MSEVRIDKIEGVMIITIDRPEAKNAVNKPVAIAIAAAIDELDASSDLSCAVLTGAGGTFCSGMDLKAFLTGELPRLPGRGFAGLVEKPPRKPLIAAVEGFALAGGFELLLACDLVVAAEGAKFGIPEVKRGLVAGAGGLIRLTRLVPRAIAMEWVLTGDFVTAGRAYEAGLINRVVENGKALDVALELARAIAKNGPLAVAVSKQVMVESADWDASEAWAKQAPIVGPVFTSEDAKEGAAAFAQKRPPQWKGR